MATKSTPTMAEQEDELVRRRLLFLQRPLKRLMKKYWALITDKTSAMVSEKERQTNLQQFMSEIDLYELNVQKAILTHLMTDEEVKIQEERNRRTDKDIEEAMKEIETLKHQLERETKIKHNKQEYDKIAKVIMEYAPRQDQQRSIQDAKIEIQRLENEKERLAQDIQDKEERFRDLFKAMNALQDSLSESKEACERFDQADHSS